MNNENRDVVTPGTGPGPSTNSAAAAALATDTESWRNSVPRTRIVTRLEETCLKSGLQNKSFATAEEKIFSHSRTLQEYKEGIKKLLILIERVGRAKRLASDRNGSGSQVSGSVSASAAALGVGAQEVAVAVVDSGTGTGTGVGSMAFNGQVNPSTSSTLMVPLRNEGRSYGSEGYVSGDTRYSSGNERHFYLSGLHCRPYEQHVQNQSQSQAQVDRQTNNAPISTSDPTATVHHYAAKREEVPTSNYRVAQAPIISTIQNPAHAQNQISSSIGNSISLVQNIQQRPLTQSTQNFVQASKFGHPPYHHRVERSQPYPIGQVLTRPHVPDRPANQLHKPLLTCPENDPSTGTQPQDISIYNFPMVESFKRQELLNSSVPLRFEQTQYHSRQLNPPETLFLDTEKQHGAHEISAPAWYNHNPDTSMHCSSSSSPHPKPSLKTISSLSSSSNNASMFNPPIPAPASSTVLPAHNTETLASILQQVKTRKSSIYAERLITPSQLVFVQKFYELRKNKSLLQKLFIKLRSSDNKEDEAIRRHIENFVLSCPNASEITMERCILIEQRLKQLGIDKLQEVETLVQPEAQVQDFFEQFFLKVKEWSKLSKEDYVGKIQPMAAFNKVRFEMKLPALSSDSSSDSDDDENSKVVRNLQTILEQEIRSLDPKRFKVDGALNVIHPRLRVWLLTPNLPVVPPLRILIPHEYPEPEHHPRLIGFDEDYNPTEFLRSIAQVFKFHKSRLLGPCTLTTLLETWETSVHKASYIN